MGCGLGRSSRSEVENIGRQVRVAGKVRIAEAAGAARTAGAAGLLEAVGLEAVRAEVGSVGTWAEGLGVEGEMEGEEGMGAEVRMRKWKEGDSALPMLPANARRFKGGTRNEERRTVGTEE